MMAAVLAFAVAAWMLAGRLGVSRCWRWVGLGALLLGVVLIHLVLPPHHPLRAGLGGSAAPWLVVAALAGVVAAYAAVLRRLRQHALRRAHPLPARASKPFSEAEAERYARHIVLREIGGTGQRRLKRARLLVIGAGGLGSAALQYLGAAGVGTLGVIDEDQVENTNLQRQVVHDVADIGMPKVFSARARILAQNPHVQVRPYHRRFVADIADSLLADYDLVLDGCDNFATRYLVNRAAARLGRPLVSGALSQWEGQLAVFDPANGTPCYRCTFPQAPGAGSVPACSQAGVLGPLPGVLGAMMAAEAIKLITGAGEPLLGRMLIHDALHAQTRIIRLHRREGCPDCTGGLNLHMLRGNDTGRQFEQTTSGKGEGRK